jgi:hypothetical protein
MTAQMINDGTVKRRTFPKPLRLAHGHRFTAWILLLALAGCAPAPGGTVGQRYMERRALAAESSKKCMDGVKSNNPVYERLNNVFIYETSDNRQFSKIINNNLVTDQQSVDLIKFREMIQPCYDQALIDYGQADDRYAKYMLVIRMQSDQNLLDLLNQRITVGDRNVYLLETLIANRRKFAEIDRDVMFDISHQKYSAPDGIDVSVEISSQSADYQKINTLQQQLRSLSQLSSPQSATFSATQEKAPRCQFVGNTIRCGEQQ